jgi:hypothetical protein
MHPPSYRDGNELGSGRVECLGTQNQNPNLKPEPDPNTDSGQNTSPELKPADTRNPLLYGNIIRAVSNFYKHIHDIYPNLLGKKGYVVVVVYMIYITFTCINKMQ